jgi:hypothetical protein
MHYIQHTETIDFNLDKAYRGALFAWPVLLNPTMLTSRSWSLRQLGFDGLGETLMENHFMSHHGQAMTFLASAVDASFVSSARADELAVLRMLVSLQNSLPSVDLAHELFRINEFDVRGGGLLFIVGAIYRKATDPRPLFMPDPEEFLVSKERLEMEVALVDGGPHYRHQILPALPLSQAIAEGLRMGVQCWSSTFDAQLRCEFDLEVNGDTTFALNAEEGQAVHLRFGKDVVSTQDMALIQEALVRCSTSSVLNQSLYMH